MNIDAHNIDEWLFNHFEGNLSLDEQSQLMDFLNAHPEFAEDLDLWSNMSIEEPEMIYPNAQDLIQEPEEAVPPHAYAGWYTVAASAVLFLLAGSFFSYLAFSDTQEIPDDWPPFAEWTTPENGAMGDVQQSALADNGTTANSNSSNNSLDNSSTNNNNSNAASLGGPNNNGPAFSNNNSVALNDNNASNGANTTNHVNVSPLNNNNSVAAVNNPNENSVVNNGANTNGNAVANNVVNNNTVQNANNAAANTNAIQNNNANAVANNASNTNAQHGTHGVDNNGTNGVDNNSSAIAQNDPNQNSNDAGAQSGNIEQETANPDILIINNDNSQGGLAQNATANQSPEGRFADPDWAKRVLKTYDYLPRTFDNLHEYAASGYEPKQKRKGVASYPGFDIRTNGLAMQDAKQQQFVVANGTPLEVNAGFAGSADEGKHRFIATYRNQWQGSSENSPQSMFFSYDKKIKGLHGGLGLTAFRDQMGNGDVFSGVSGIYSYHMKLGKNTVLQPAVKSSFMRHVHSNPEVQDSDLRTYGAGMVLHTKRFYAGVGADHFFGNGSNGVIGFTGYEQTLTAQIGTDFRNGESGDWVISPHALYKRQAGIDQVTLGTVVRYRNLMSGVGYTTNNGFRATAGLQTDNFRIGYSFELPTAENTAFQNFNTHELGIQLLLK